MTSKKAYRPRRLPPRGDDGAWRDQAECRPEEPELFFPVGSTGPAAEQIEEAKAVCRRCPVMQQCLGWALDTRQDHGVWGGRTETERRTIRRRRTEAQRAARRAS